MEKVRVVASFTDESAAEDAVSRFADPAAQTRRPAANGGSGREGSFIVRLVLIVVFWSVIGTAVGAAVGAFLSYTVGPGGTDGLILQVVSWAIFAHVLIGLWAGYALLADRSRRELVDAEPTVTFQAERQDAAALARALQEAGATKVVIQSMQ